MCVTEREWIVRHRPLGERQGEPTAGLSAESEAALRQLTHQRLLGYGVEYGDALELRGAVEAGHAWRDAAEAMAARLCARLKDPDTEATRRDLHLRASALLRMAQMMMLADSDARRDLYMRASGLFEAATEGEGTWSRLVLETEAGPVVGWRQAPSGRRPRGTVLVIGGIEGWAMDLAGLGDAVAARGFEALLLDGPGQGETRLEHRHFLDADWLATFKGIVDAVEAGQADWPIGIIGNSMGGNFAMLAASADRRIAACCNNGGIPDPLTQRARSGFFPKMEAFCGRVPDGAIERAWRSVEVTQARLSLECPFLIVQGGLDPLVSPADSERMLGWARSSDKRMHVFEDGDHCIYKRPADKHALIGDWLAERLGPPA